MNRYVDTNILVRIMTNDVPHLAEQAFDEIQRARSGELLVTDEVLDELFTLLERNALYKLPRQSIVKLAEGIIKTPQFELSAASLDAFDLYAKHPKLDFVDCLLAAKAGKKRARVLTFDKELQAILTA